MRLYPEEVARYFGIANLADFDVKKHDLGTSPTTRKPLIDAIDAASKDEVTAFWTKFANQYVDNLVSALLIFLETNPSNIDTPLISNISTGSQFSRYIRKHPNGSLVLPKIIERFSVMCPKGNDLDFDDNDPSSCYRTEVLAHQVFAQCNLIIRTLKLSSSSLTLASLTPSVQTAASVLLRCLLDVIVLVPKILVRHDHYFARNPKPSKALKLWLEDALFHAKGVVPFLRGEVTPGEMRDWDNQRAVSWWECEVTVTEDPFNSRRCSRASLQRCGGCDAVCYCSKEHQKQHWKAHKLECLKPAW